MKNKEFKYLKINQNIHLLVYEIDRIGSSVEILYHAGGSWFESDADRGKKHLLEHCIVARTKEKNHKQLKDWEFRENIFLNAFTSPLQMGLTGSCHNSDLNKMFELLWKMTTNPVFDQADLDREKEIVLREISQRRGKPSYQLYYDTMKAIYTEDSVDNHQTLGDPVRVAETTIEDFQRLNQESLNQSQILISIIGKNIDIEHIEQLISSYQTPQSPLELNYEPKSVFNDFKYLPIVHPNAHEHADVSFYFPCEVNQDNKAIRAVVGNMMFGHHGKIYERLREEKQLVYGLDYYFDINPANLVIDLQAEIKLVGQIKNEVLEILNNFEKYLDRQRFDEFKRTLIKKEELNADSPRTITTFAKSSLLNFGELQDYNTYSKILQNVTFESLLEYFTALKNNLSQMRIVVTSKDSSIKELDL